MSQLIPVSTEAAATLESTLSETMFQSTDKFIEFYNSGLINKSSDEVSSLAVSVNNTFKNVKLQNKNLMFISREEVEITEVLHELRKWEILVKIKDRLSEELEEMRITEDTVVEFNNSVDGVLFRASEEYGDTQHAEKIFEERFFKASKQYLVDEVHAERSSVPSSETNKALRFYVRDFTSLNDEFVSTLHETLGLAE